MARFQVYGPINRLIEQRGEPEPDQNDFTVARQDRAPEMSRQSTGLNEIAAMAVETLDQLQHLRRELRQMANTYAEAFAELKSKLDTLKADFGAKLDAIKNGSVMDDAAKAALADLEASIDDMDTKVKAIPDPTPIDNGGTVSNGGTVATGGTVDTGGTVTPPAIQPAPGA